MPTRWVLAEPLGQLARSPHATSGELTRLAELARHDPDWPVRAHAVELAAGIAPLTPTLIASVADPEPRVREAALRGIGRSKVGAGSHAAANALATDPWTFVRVAAAEALAETAADAASRAALDRALDDRSPRVRSAVLEALGRLHATEFAKRIRRRLDDGREDPEVRALAARTLGSICARDATDDLVELALLSRAPVEEADERIGLAAIEALGQLHPPDLEKRFAPLRAKGVSQPVRRAAERAIAEPGACR
jgi:aminopeptidase N